MEQYLTSHMVLQTLSTAHEMSKKTGYEKKGAYASGRHDPQIIFSHFQKKSQEARSSENKTTRLFEVNMESSKTPCLFLYLERRPRLALHRHTHSQTRRREDEPKRLSVRLSHDPIQQQAHLKLSQLFRLQLSKEGRMFAKSSP